MVPDDIQGRDQISQQSFPYLIQLNFPIIYLMFIAQSCSETLRMCSISPLCWALDHFTKFYPVFNSQLKSNLLLKTSLLSLFGYLAELIPFSDLIALVYQWMQILY